MELLGYVAGTLTTFAFIPQVARIFRTRSADDLSWWWLFMSLAGIFLWLVYALSIGSFPMVLFNVITLILFVAICIAKQRFQVGTGAKSLKEAM